MNVGKVNFPRLLNSAVLTLFLLSSVPAFAGGGWPDDEKRSNAPSIQMKAPASSPSPEQEVNPPASPHAAPSSSATPSAEERLQELQRRAEIARLERQIAEDEAAALAAKLQAQQAPQPNLLQGAELLEAFRGGRSDARIQRNLNKNLGKGFGGFLGAFLGLPPTRK